MDTLSLNKRHIDLLNDRQINLLIDAIDLQISYLEEDTDLYIELCNVRNVCWKTLLGNSEDLS